ncbi:MAG TPA: LysR family transcriptional regulator [Acidimicrobiales bacterium]|nr:LysR family transcriptional regulator [Acidimicrobiales bacterium]
MHDARPSTLGIGVDLDLRQVRYFVVVADELHFGRAATKLHVSQPALSKQIRKLEEQLGVRLLVRDSRHVALTVRGEEFLGDARELLKLAERMQQIPDGNRVRIAHVFELATSREVSDAYSKARPDVTIVEHAMDSVTQLEALLENRLDIAILRVTSQMLHDHPKGWSHALLRLEPLRLVGRPGDPARPTVSLFERPIEVFGDPPASGLHKAYGNFLTAFERSLGLSMRWLGTPGAFSHCLAVIDRATEPAFLLEFDSYALRYEANGLPVSNPEEVSPHYPWSIAWRDGRIPEATADFLEIAQETGTSRDWRDFDLLQGAPPWLPPDDPVAAELGFQSQIDVIGVQRRS